MLILSLLPFAYYNLFIKLIEKLSVLVHIIYFLYFPVVGTYQLFRTVRSAATLYHARRRTTLTSPYSGSFPTQNLVVAKERMVWVLRFVTVQDKAWSVIFHWLQPLYELGGEGIWSGLKRLHMKECICLQQKCIILH